MHHASLLIGGRSQALAYVESLFGSLKGSPDYFSSTEETFGIGEARELSQQAARKAFGAQKVFFVAPETITPEAQNALLKTFEEPAAETYFFLALRDAGPIIPTLLSRMQTISLEAAESNDDAGEFLKMPLKKRMAFVKKFVDAEKSLPTFLDSLLLELKKGGKNVALGSVFQMRLAADQRAASPRLILEHMAAVL